MDKRELETIESSIPARDFFKTYISKRHPVVVKGLPDDESFKARAWTDLRYLSSKAGSAPVLVEPLHPSTLQFGTDVQRLSMPFSDFVQSLQTDDNNGSHHYLTTQYAEQDGDELTALPPPADRLVDDFPRVPRMMGNLVLQQVNLWLGRSKDGSTSGLHHDFHDNLYCLLRGHKRFVLYPPSSVKHLYPYGTLETLHPNGVISYVSSPVRADGLPMRLALKTRVKAIEAQLDALSAGEAKGKSKGKGKGREDSKARRALVEAHDEALDELARYTLEAEDGVDVGEEVDDFDELMAGLGDDEFADEDGDVSGDIRADDDGEEDDGDEEGDSESDDDAGEGFADEGSETDSKEPPSFSRIPTALLHKSLNLPTTALPPPSASLTSFPNFSKTPAPYVVELNAGDILYLPASWWHEVTSSSGNGDEKGGAVHMAFNYWFYPPDNLGSFDAPYADTLVWDYLRAQDGGAGGVMDDAGKVEADQEGSAGKRKGEAVGFGPSKRSRR